jgi:hypothetical protein
MKRTVSILGILFFIVGGIWILQGINVLPGSFMTGQRVWAYRGGALAIAGLLMVRFTRRR